MSDSAPPSTPDTTALQFCARLLDLERPLVILDLETTGTDFESDRIIQVGLARIEPGGDVEPFSQLVHPGRSVPQKVQELTGITDEMLVDAPSFAEVLDRVNEYLKGADLCGYNVARFDLPFLQSAVERVGGTLTGPSDRQVIDVYEIFRKREPHSLRQAVLYYTGAPPEKSHEALSDVLSTGQVLASQLVRYNFSGTAEEIVSNVRHPHIDAGGKLKWDGDQVVICFGKHEGETIKDLEEKDPGYLDWIIREIGGEVAEAVVERRTAIEKEVDEWMDEVPF